jgi:two-component system, chemotaxis family, CheB/CheR fusion protein
LNSTEQSPERFAQDDATANTLDSPSTDQSLSVIGIGSSAGGLRPLQAFFTALPADTGMCFVVVTHLSPEHESMLAELLQPYTQMPVRQVMERVEMQPNHVYVIPPGKRLLVSDKGLDLDEFDMRRGQRLQIDSFFRSLGEHHGDGAAIILSGTGSDGAVGMQSIKENGGLLLVQDPKEAEYDGMPRSAIATGLVDIVAPVAELAAKLVEAKRTQASLKVPQEPEKLSETAQQTLAQILTQLRTRMGHDFSGYRKSTLLRRISRRMALARAETLPDYLKYLREESEEIEILFRDLLIHVTEFFRDSEAWERLAEQVIPQLFVGKRKNDTIRIWSVGCATGEEAYSLAILLMEHSATLANPPEFQIFASDLGKNALEFARAGIYPEAIAANVSEQRLDRFFERDNSHYRVRPDVRERILFTPHNLLQDPPFSRLDLITCRNLLIYLERELQERVFESFHYGLNPQGYLFLGSAESIGGMDNLFETADKQYRIYRRSQKSRETRVLPSLPLSSRTLLAGGEEQRRGGRGVDVETHRRALEEVGPPSLLVDETYTVLHLSETAGRYLLPPGGRPTSEATKLVRPELQPALRAALFDAFERGQSSITRPIPVRFNGASSPVILMVRPLPQRKRALVLFLEDEKWGDAWPGAGQDPGDQSVSGTRSTQELEGQLHQTQQRLQSMRKEYETTVEELRATNEELQSTNEEYKSTLEELETSKEELQSVNEELHTINLEMKFKVEEVSQAHSDLQNLLASTEIATLFLDRHLCIGRYTPRAAQLFNLMPSDKDRPIIHLRSNLAYEELEADARSVLATLRPVEREVRDGDGHWYLVALRPYRTLEDRIDGVVITFVDITTNKVAELALAQSEERYRLLMENVREYAIFMLDTDSQITTWNTGAERIFGYTKEEAIGRKGSMIFTPEDRAAGAPEQEMASAMQSGQAADDRWHLRKDGSRFWASGILAALYHPDGSLRGFGKVLRDNSERREAEEKLKEINESLEQRVAERTRQVRSLASTLTMAEQVERRRISQILHDDLQQLLYSIQMRAVSIMESVKSDERDRMVRYTQEVYTWISDAVQMTRRLTVDLSPPVLANEGLTDALHWLITQMAEVHGLTVEIQAEHSFRLPNDDMRVLLFQTVRELLFNVVKHAGVAQATVELRQVDEEIVITVQDEGKGFNVEGLEGGNHKGFGLFSTRERLQLFGGRIEIASTPGRGTIATVYAPMHLPAGLYDIC